MRRLAALVTRHPRRVLALAGAFFVAAVLVGGPIVGALQTSLSDFENPSSQTARVTSLIDGATHAQDEAGMVVLLRSAGDVRASEAARSDEARVAQLLSRQRGFRSAIDYANTADPELISRDGDETLLLATFTTRSLSYAAAQRLGPQLRASHAIVGGLDVVFEELTHRSRTDLERAELFALPLLIALSLWIFRGVVAALLPLLVGALAIFGTFLCLRVVEQALGVSVFALNLVSALGLGLAIDYSLFVLSRFREEISAVDGAHGVTAAIERTLQTAGRTVLFSALTVAAAMSSLTVFPLRFLYSMGVAGVITALAAGAAALVVLPAALAVLGTRVNALAPARLQRSAIDPGPHSRDRGIWWRLAHAVMRRPGSVAAASALALLLAGAPALDMGLTPASASLLPTSSPARQVEEAVKREFAADPSLPIAAVMQAPANEFGTVLAYARQVASASGEPSHVRLLHLGSSTWVVAVPPRGDPFGTANERLVRRLRAIKAPDPVAVGGITAWFMDQMATLSDNLPYALLIVALTMFATIFAMTGSAVLPVKTLLMNVLTLWATTGLLVLAFQDGGLGGVLDFRANGGLEPSNLVLLFTVAFALASDYGVFLLGRIKEAHDSGLANRDAVALGLARTGRLVTAAALLFCVAVGALGSSSILSIKELGLGAAIAVALDASVVRALLVPSLMALLGDWNWWAPTFLRRLHPRLALREGPADGAPARREPVA